MFKQNGEKLTNKETLLQSYAGVTNGHGKRQAKCFTLSNILLFEPVGYYC